MKMKNKELILILSPFFLFMGNLYAGTGYGTDSGTGRAAVTADAQKDSSQRDTEITRRVRERIMQDANLSTSAKNITIVTKGGQVTLSGGVTNADEKKRVEELAKSVTGEAPVSNQTVISR
ncbi:BON domain-containing protein [Bdellovibrio sp. HCB2-146]|uniref:BON domain-containing protein n=1 Tax=Bdellovibrio sp. HCB2-146 TaxID=3394362 RepID=UPI0039BCC0D7